MDQQSAVVLLPIIITLVLSLTTKNVILGLFFGVFSGVIMLSGWDLFNSFGLLVKDHLAPQLTDSYNAGVLVLLIFIGGFVALMEQSGGGQAFASKVTHWISNKTRGQFSAWIGGITIFFSDLGTPLIVGPVFRPLFDKLKLSREKLAFIIDSTSSPVAILIPFIGWGVYIMGLIQKELTAVNSDISDWDAFISAIPFQFYAILAVGIVPLIALTKLDFGPMATAEKLAQQGKSVVDHGSSSLTAFSHPNAKASFIGVPLVVMAGVLAYMLVPLGFPFEKVAGSVFRGALSTAYFSAAVALIGLMAWYKVRSLNEGIQVYLQGMSRMIQVAIILVLAWALSGISKELGTAAYIAELAQAGFPNWLLPAITFLLAAIISFATGSSWGTFAIMMPLVIPTVFAIDAPLYACIGAVLSGGLFGDHCSPISETTILSSTGAGCDQFQHFRTQLPYALLNGSIAFISFLVAGFVESSLVFVGAMCLQVCAVVMLAKFTKKPELQLA